MKSAREQVLDERSRIIQTASDMSHHISTKSTNEITRDDFDLLITTTLSALDARMTNLEEAVEILFKNFNE